nr:hypothetical protein [Herbaspirillum sp. GW103]
MIFSLAEQRRRRYGLPHQLDLDDELELSDYGTNFCRMFGDARMDASIGSVNDSVRFFGLTPTSMKLEGLDRHQHLQDSYRKPHKARARFAQADSASAA